MVSEQRKSMNTSSRSYYCSSLPSSRTSSAAIVHLDESDIVEVIDPIGGENTVNKNQNRTNDSSLGGGVVVVDVESPPVVDVEVMDHPFYKRYNSGLDGEDDDNNFSHLKEPLLQAEACPISPLQEAAGTFFLGGGGWGNRPRSGSYGALMRDSAQVVGETVEAVPVGHMRPEFLFVKVIKPNKSTGLGVLLKGKRGYVKISKIHDHGLLANSPLRPGDEVKAVNGISCCDAMPSDVAAVVAASKDTVSLLVRNADGRPGLVSSTIQKRKHGDKVGIAMKSERGAVVVSKVHGDGLFASSLLMPGHRCIAVNGYTCESMDANDVKACIDMSSDFVTMVSRPRNTGNAYDLAMVLSCETHAGWWRNFALAAGGLAVGAVTVAQALT